MTAQCKRTRFEEFDIGRAIAILGLPMVHVLEEADSIDLLPHGFMNAHLFLLALSALGAPLFMACMGANMVFTRHAAPRELAKRGVLLLVTGVLLNIARYAAPDIIFGHLPGATYTGDWLIYTLMPDIYDFSGGCFLAFALFKKLDLSPCKILVIAAVCLVTGAYLLPVFFADPNINNLTCFMGRFFWVNENSCFPLLTWLIFPALGYAFGHWFKNAQTDQARWAGLCRMMPVAAAVFAATAIYVVVTGGDLMLAYASPANSYITDIPNVALVSSTLVFVAALVHKLALALKETRALLWLVRTSKGIIPYYTCQWVVIGWAEYFIHDLHLEPYTQLNELNFWLFSLAVVATSLWFSRFWMSFKASRSSRMAASGTVTRS